MKIVELDGLAKVEPITKIAKEAAKYDKKEIDRPGEFHLFPILASFMVSMLLLSNLMSSAKFIDAWGITMSASVLVYPFVFLAGDALTEVYGYNRTRRVIWAGGLVFVFSSIIIWIVGAWPAASFFTNQEAYDQIFSSMPRIFVASFFSYFIGEFFNAFIVAKLKVKMERKYKKHNSFWSIASRFIFSTFVSQFFDSIIFFPIAFYGTIPNAILVEAVISGWLFKSVWETLFIPVTVPFVLWLKRIERSDHLDLHTDFNPLHIH